MSNRMILRICVIIWTGHAPSNGYSSAHPAAKLESPVIILAKSLSGLFPGAFAEERLLHL